MNESQAAITQLIYNLILNPATRDWEREQLVHTKNALEAGKGFSSEIDRLEGVLRPLALRDNLTPDVADFYAKLTNNEQDPFDLSRHYATDQPYEERAVFAGGCFWCMVEPFETRPGIIAVISGYTGGHVDHPTYDQVLTQATGHVEAVEIIFDNRIVKYTDLVELFWQITDPTDDQGQINDRGIHYRPVIFVQNEEQRRIATASKQRLADSGRYKKPIVTAIESATTFWPAENYHQQFYKKHRKRYQRMERSREEYLAVQHFRGNIRMGWRKLTNK